MQRFDRLFAHNRDWAARTTAADPDFFKRLSNQQQPDFLWIGCSDSRVPANQIIGLDPGEVFVHRNIANVVDPTDLNCSAVIEFAVDLLKVEHILVVGHYGCSGVKAALCDTPLGLAGQWLQRVKKVKTQHLQCLRVLPDEAAQHDRLCELNVVEQVNNLCSTQTVRAAWNRQQLVMVHGCIYDLHDGVLRDLRVSCSSASEAQENYTSAIARLQTG
jgi:carbonic anhydrase